jgi:hypothetical protein
MSDYAVPREEQMEGKEHGRRDCEIDPKQHVST